MIEILKQRYDLENLLDLEISRNESNKFSELLINSRFYNHLPGEILLWSVAAILLLKLIQYYIDTDRDNRDKPIQDQQEIPTAEDTKFTLFDDRDFLRNLHENYSLNFHEDRDIVLGMTGKDYLVGIPDGGVDWLLGEMENNLTLNNSEEVNLILGKASQDYFLELNNQTIENIATTNRIVSVYGCDAEGGQSHQASSINLVGAKHSGDNLCISPEYSYRNASPCLTLTIT